MKQASKLTNEGRAPRGRVHAAVSWRLLQPHLTRPSTALFNRPPPDAGRRFNSQLSPPAPLGTPGPRDPHLTPKPHHSRSSGAQLLRLSHPLNARYYPSLPLPLTQTANAGNQPPRRAATAIRVDERQPAYSRSAALACSDVPTLAAPAARSHPPPSSFRPFNSLAETQ